MYTVQQHILHTGQGLKNAKIPWNMVKNCVKNVKFLEEKDQNIHLNEKFPLKIANLSLQKKKYIKEKNIPGMRLPNSTFFPWINPGPGLIH